METQLPISPSLWDLIALPISPVYLSKNLVCHHDVLDKKVKKAEQSSSRNELIQKIGPSRPYTPKIIRSLHCGAKKIAL
jgi:hypothetical protein